MGAAPTLDAGIGGGSALYAAEGCLDPMSLETELLTVRQTEERRQHRPHSNKVRGTDLLEEEDAAPTLDAGIGGGSALNAAEGRLDPMSFDAGERGGGAGGSHWTRE